MNSYDKIFKYDVSKLMISRRGGPSGFFIVIEENLTDIKFVYHVCKILVRVLQPFSEISGAHVGVHN